MIHLLERIGIVKTDNNKGFKMIPAIIMMVLMLAFVGTTFYILISSLNS